MNYIWNKEKNDWVQYVDVIYSITVSNTKKHKKISYYFTNFDEVLKFKYMLENLNIENICENISIECYKNECYKKEIES